MSEIPYGWQPIETAPKDGTQVILFFTRRHDQEADHIMVGGFEGGDFMVLAGVDFKEIKFFTTLVMPWTHWMPLPSPPKP